MKWCELGKLMILNGLWGNCEIVETRLIASLRDSTPIWDSLQLRIFHTNPKLRATTQWQLKKTAPYCGINKWWVFLGNSAICFGIVCAKNHWIYIWE